MKNLTIAVVLVLAALGAQAQTISAAEYIEKVKCPNAACYRTFFTSKGYTELKDDDTSENELGFYFNSKDKKDLISFPDMSINISIEDYNNGIMVATADKAVYQALLKDFVTQGFALAEENKEEEVSTYKNTKNSKLTLKTLVIPYGTEIVNTLALEFEK